MCQRQGLRPFAIFGWRAYERHASQYPAVYIYIGGAASHYVLTCSEDAAPPIFYIESTEKMEVSSFFDRIWHSYALILHP